MPTFTHAQQIPQPAIILVGPQMGENIGMVARAMWNCGLTDLRLVAPRDGWPNPAAVDTSAGAVDVIDNARLFDNTESAIADLHTVYATTGRPRGMTHHVVTAKQSAHEMHTAIAQGKNVGVLFGAERTGLENHHVSLATHIIEIPLNDVYKSLNLAQAVLVVAYEWFQYGDKTAERIFATGDTEPATMAEVDFFVDKLMAELQGRDFFRAPELEPIVHRNIRNMFNRSTLTKQEVKTLHGIIKTLIKSE